MRESRLVSGIPKGRKPSIIGGFEMTLFRLGLGMVYFNAFITSSLLMDFVQKNQS
jgi:hypothetical protein